MNNIGGDDEFEATRKMVIGQHFDLGQPLYSIKAAVGMIKIMGGADTEFGKGFIAGMAAIELIHHEGMPTYLSMCPHYVKASAYATLGVDPALQDVLDLFSSAGVQVDGLWVEARGGALRVTTSVSPNAVWVSLREEDGDVLEASGFCYLALIEDEYLEQVALKCGPKITVQQMMELPLRSFRPEWGSLLVGKRGATYHVPSKKGVRVDEVFSRLAAEREWPPGSLGASSLWGPIGDYGVSLGDVLAGSAYDGEDVVIPRFRTPQVQCLMGFKRSSAFGPVFPYRSCVCVEDWPPGGDVSLLVAGAMAVVGDDVLLSRRLLDDGPEELRLRPAVHVKALVAIDKGGTGFVKEDAPMSSVCSTGKPKIWTAWLTRKVEDYQYESTTRSTLLICLSQEDKAVVVRTFLRERIPVQVLTVHEARGLVHPHVRWVRIVKVDQDHFGPLIDESSAYASLAMYTHSLGYCVLYLD